MYLQVSFARDVKKRRGGRLPAFDERLLGMPLPLV